MTITGKQLILALAATISGAAPALAGAISAELATTSAGVGEPVALTVVAEGDADGEPEIPEVPGLNIQAVGRGYNRTVTNGQVIRETTWTYVVQAMRLQAAERARRNLVQGGVHAGGDGTGRRRSPACCRSLASSRAPLNFVLSARPAR